LLGEVVAEPSELERACLSMEEIVAVLTGQPTAEPRDPDPRSANMGDIARCNGGRRLSALPSYLVLQARLSRKEREGLAC
jgi:hypothetical protein